MTEADWTLPMAFYLENITTTTNIDLVIAIATLLGVADLVGWGG